MTFPYGTVLRDSTDGEVVMTVSRGSAVGGWPYFNVVVLVMTDRAIDSPTPVGQIAYRSVDLPQWERLS